MKTKKRWPQKRNGLPHKSYCQVCLSFGCDSFSSPNSIANRKRRERRRLKLCEACGQKVCKCKNKGKN